MEIEIPYQEKNPMHEVVSACIEKNDILTENDVTQILSKTMKAPDKKGCLDLFKKYCFTIDSSHIRDMSGDGYISKYPIDYFEQFSQMIRPLFAHGINNKHAEDVVSLITSLATLKLYYQCDYVNLLTDKNLMSIAATCGSESIRELRNSILNIRCKYFKKESIYIPKKIHEIFASMAIV